MCNGIVHDIRKILGKYRSAINERLSPNSQEYRDFSMILDIYGNGNLNRIDNSRAKRELKLLKEICIGIGITVE
jgi:hypothetical protein